MQSIPQTKDQITHLYVARAGRGGFVKVGITTNPARRLKQSQTDCPLEIRYITCIECVRAYDVEQWIHEQLQHRRIRGEWFWVWSNAYMDTLIRRAVELRDCGELPCAPPYWKRLHPWTLRATVRSAVLVNLSADPPKPPRSALDRTRQAVLDELLTHGWTITDLRREGILRGDNAAVSQEVAETRKRLGLPEPDRTLRVRDATGERVIAFSPPVDPRFRDLDKDSHPVLR